jgi:hypothetical protein
MALLTPDKVKQKNISKKHLQDQKNAIRFALALSNSKNKHL